MAVNTETHVNASVVMEKEIYEKLKALSQKNKRSVSKQILFWIEEKLDAEIK
jgi:predicted DNA-binding protein